LVSRELPPVRDELLVVLEHAAMAGVWVDLERSVRKTVGKVESLPSQRRRLAPAGKKILRTSAGSFITITCGMDPPRENPIRSTCSSPSARMKAIASSAMAETLVGVQPLLPPTPRLSKVITRRSDEPVDHPGIPVVQNRREVVQEDNGHTGFAQTRDTRTP
jgi:hypothetical protein